MKRLALFAIAPALLAACDTPSAPPPLTPSLQVISMPPSSAGPLFHFTYLLTSTVTNTCPPMEEVAIEGMMHYIGTGAGETPTSTDIKVHVNMQRMEGVGLTSGDRYRVIQNDKEDVQFSFPPAQFEVAFDSRFRLIREGSAENLWVRQTARIAYPPEVIEVIWDVIECRG